MPPFPGPVPAQKKPLFDDTAIMKHWTTVLRNAGVRYRNSEQTRHTDASLLLSARESDVGGVANGPRELGE